MRSRLFEEIFLRESDEQAEAQQQTQQAGKVAPKKAESEKIIDYQKALQYFTALNTQRNAGGCKFFVLTSSDANMPVIKLYWDWKLDAQGKGKFYSKSIAASVPANIHADVLAKLKEYKEDSRFKYADNATTFSSNLLPTLLKGSKNLTDAELPGFVKTMSDEQQSSRSYGMDDVATDVLISATSG
jgi:hypothetical protein